MPTKDVRPFRNPSNVDIFNAVRKYATVDYQRRIPAATQANVQDTIHNLLTYRPQMNEFIDSLVNRIGAEIYKGISWTNPLSKFKRGMLEFGDTIEEINVGLIQAKVYDPDRQNLENEIWGAETPDVQSSFHKINRQNYYKLTVNEMLLRRAFLSDYGLSGFITQLMQSPQTSDEYDEFLTMTSLFRQWYDAGGIFKVQIGDIANSGSDEADSKYALRRLREFSGNLAFPSTRYNPAGMPVAANPDELELFITPEANAALDVEALAGAFNENRANFDARTTVIPQEYFNIPGVQAILTTRDFFVVADSLIETTNAPNPVGLHTNYFLHHHQVVSASRFVPAIMLTTEEGTPIVIADEPEITDVTTPVITNAAGETVTEVERGQLYNVFAEGVSTADNDAVRYELEGDYNIRTYVSQTGMLHIFIGEEATSVTVNAYAVHSDVPQVLDTITVPIVGNKVNLWPNPEVETDSDTDSLFEVTPAALTKDDDDNVTIPNVKGVQYKKEGVNVNNGTVHNITAETDFTAVARTGYELAAGATASWTFNP